MTMGRTPRSTHPYYMYECIQDQPQAIRQVLDSQKEPVEALVKRIEAAQRVHIVGIGSSWHASLTRLLDRRVSAAASGRQT